MKTFDVYQNTQGDTQAVKKGWSWPGFFFTWIWCFVKGLPGTAIGILVIAFADMFILNMLSNYILEYERRNMYSYYNAYAYPQPYPYWSLVLIVISYLMPLAVTIWIGSKGNKKRREKLIWRGYTLKDTVSATGPDMAITLVINRDLKDLNTKFESNSASDSSKKTSKSDLSQLEELYNLKEKGVITDEDFKEKKKQILNLD